MPLLDHFRPPLAAQHHWESFHSNWATRLADQLNERLPEGYLAEVTTHASNQLEIDVVTSRRANLHNETLRLMGAGAEFEMSAEIDLYAAAYRPLLRQDRPHIDFWPETLTIGSPLPTLPLRLIGDLFVPVDFEPAY